MFYEFKYTEVNNEKSGDYETKSLLHLIARYKNSGKLSVIFIDCFNDVTGADEGYLNLYDVQSKGVENLSPGDIGKSLATLYLNFINSFPFSEFALFTPKFKKKYLIDSDAKSFGSANFVKKTLVRINKGLRKEIVRRDPALDNANLEHQINEFLNVVIFLIDDKEKFEYVKEISDFKNKDIKEVGFYDSIFTDIRLKQLSKKQKSLNEVVVQQVVDILNYEHHIYVSDIFQLLANRFVGSDVFNSPGIPMPFLPEIIGKNSQEISELKTECMSEISRSFFDKNKQNLFWSFLENVLNNILLNPSATARHIYDKSCLIKGFEYCGLYGMAGIYFVSMIMEGIIK
jgi:hypothetical protein